MKKHLLIVASLFFGASLYGQFTQGNAPTAGDQSTMFIMDSLTVDYAGITGDNVVWDYSNAVAYEGLEKSITAMPAASNSYASNFPSATIALEIEDFITTFYTNNPEDRMSQGYAFLNPTIGEVIARLSTQEAKLYDYPFDLNSTLTSDFSGEGDMDIELLESPLYDNPLAGSLTASVDGRGTLKLTTGDYTNVYRYKLVDSVVAQVDFSIVVLDVQMLRTQYEYYDFTVSNLPLFVHSHLEVEGLPGIEVPPSSTVLSLKEIVNVASVSTHEMEGVIIYPNPATEKLTIQLPTSVEEAMVSITDELGRSVYQSNINSPANTIDVSTLNSGVYFVRLTNGKLSTVESVIIK